MNHELFVTEMENFCVLSGETYTEQELELFFERLSDVSDERFEKGMKKLGFQKWYKGSAFLGEFVQCIPPLTPAWL